MLDNVGETVAISAGIVVSLTVTETLIEFQTSSVSSVDIGLPLGLMYVASYLEKKNISVEDIKTKVIPDLLVYSAWLAEEFDVNIEQAYLTRFVGNLRRLHAEKVPLEELKELEDYINERFEINQS